MHRQRLAHWSSPCCRRRRESARLASPRRGRGWSEAPSVGLGDRSAFRHSLMRSRTAEAVRAWGRRPTGPSLERALPKLTVRTMLAPRCQHPTRKIHGGSPQALRESNKRLLLERLLHTPDGLTRPETCPFARPHGHCDRQSRRRRRRSLAAVIDEASVGAHSQRAISSGPIPKVVRLKQRLGYVIGITLGKPVSGLPSQISGALDGGPEADAQFA